MRKILIFSISTVILLASCKSNLTNKERDLVLSEASHFHNAMDKLTDIIVHDIFSPPVASRVYVYPCLAAYEVLQNKPGSKLTDLNGKLHDFTDAPSAQDTSNLSYDLAAMEAYFAVSKALIFSEDQLNEHTNKFYHELDSIGISPKTIEVSKSYGQVVAAHILDWASKDNYNQTRAFPKYTITDVPEEWKPTPPAYMEGIEPHWREIRPMVIDSAAQFVPKPPPNFDMDKRSEFYQKTLEVYNAVKNATDEHKEIASFWDCNPYVMNQRGHMMFASKKITPGGHWMGITNIVARKAEYDLTKSIELTSFVAIGLFDGFISCWDEKYRSNLIRPETVINEHIDEAWVPLLQTPPFPEHTSGHSVISTSAATILTAMVGSSFEYEDDVEVKYGLPARSFSSFLEASNEAAISRLYGGIHYMPAITEGVAQGKQVGDFITERLLTKE